MKTFMDEDFLLGNQTAIRLYHDYAKEMPIFDFHCHLNPQVIAENRKFQNISDLSLSSDHYKWRAMRSNGIAEHYITGNASDREKFLKWAETMPYCIGNPLYHWTHMELQRYFGIRQLLNPKTAEAIWKQCNEQIQTEHCTPQELIRQSNVRVLYTTDDPTDSLEYHQALAKNTAFPVKVFPAFRPDKAIQIDKDGFCQYVAKLGDVIKGTIQNVDELKNALKTRMEFFHGLGCRISDHALDPIIYHECTDDEANSIFKKVLRHEQLSELENGKFKTNILVFLGREYARLGWVMQLHIGVIRNNNRRMMDLLGPDTGFDTISDDLYARDLVKYLNALDDQLPKTVLYCCNPQDNEVLGTIIGCFQGGEAPGKMQFGPAWWFNDQKDGMIRQMTALANLGLLSRFVGMLTDSRSFLSYIRHEYFRRILCNLLGDWVESGEVPDDMELLGKMVQDISFNNARNYFKDKK
jgi:glucuronate isomerase